ncbi:hypothetical protein POX_c03780 [Penicillium oxalicum]|uniref:hypothetical protein n=1 Tax=Penicillium oxalicum TaxID=69781 RepID=UPI0020B76CBC|nr:hypothetical protein POX_c03780 [Penicillium oxalicum]KAI2790928.1 hypothetical protein POX_c03780 [Penicillium oxalicum]
MMAPISQGESNLSLSPLEDASIVQSHLATSLNANLLHHFFSTVVSRLTWLDSGPANPWRRLIQPLASKSSRLKLSIAGLAAAHLAATVSEESQSSFFLQMNHSLRTETVKDLSHGLRIELDPYQAIPNTDRSSESEILEMLASALVLCYSEMHIPSSMDWGLHLRACRAMIERYYLLSRSKSLDDSLSNFLVKEVADLETFGNLAGTYDTNSTAIDRNLKLALHSNLWTFTALIDEISTAERLNCRWTGTTHSVGDPDMNGWHDKLDAAYDRATEMVTSLPDCEVAQDVFRLVIDSHYYATLLYCYQCLTLPGEHEQRKQEFCDVLWHTIQSVTERSSAAFIHDLFFPLFIVGTQCVHDPQRQALVEAVFLRTMYATGFWCNQTALQMLRFYWQHSDKTIDENWVRFARRNAATIGPFVIF